MKNFAGIVALLFFLFAGCSASRPRFQETLFATQPVPADKARIIVLRLNDSYIGGRWARLDIDGAAVGKLGRGEFLVIDTVPGEREISVDEGEAKGRFVLKRNFEAQQIYDLQVSRREERKKYEATGTFALIGELFAPLLNGDEGLFILEPVPAWQVLKMLENLELSE